MVTILVDEAYAFDFLSILEVKLSVAENPVVREKYNEQLAHLAGQLGASKLNSILKSEEYASLVDANRKTFEWVDMAKTDSCLASDVDKSNFVRCEMRKRLQDRFFTGSEITEVKFGYERYGKN